MPIDLDASGVESPDQLGQQGPLPGRYHVVEKSYDESFKDSDAIVAEYEVLAGTTPGQAGKIQKEFWPVSSKSLDRLKRLAMITGRLKPGERKSLTFADGRFCHLVIEVDTDEYQGKKRNKITYMGFWACDHADVKDVPKDLDALAKWPNGGQAQQTQAPLATQPPAGQQQPPQTHPPQTPPPAGGDDWNDV